MCQKCGKRTATVHYTQSINGAVREEHLCGECADSIGKGAGFGGTGGFGGGFDDLFGNLFGGGAYRRGVGNAPTVKVCDMCGASMRDFRESGKLGCPKCYEVFASELASTVTGIHGNVRHVGRAPGKHKEMMERQARIDELKARQARAVEEQDYELAAKLRDEIKALRDGGGSEETDKKGGAK